MSACFATQPPADDADVTVPATLPLKYSGPATSAAITAGDLMTRLYVFADDSLMGREAGTEGHMKGTAYIERELRRMGLEPAGDNGTFFQNVPFIARRFSPVRDAHGRRRDARAFQDFVTAPVPRRRAAVARRRAGGVRRRRWATRERDHRGAGAGKARRPLERGAQQFRLAPTLATRRRRCGRGRRRTVS